MHTIHLFRHARSHGICFGYPEHSVKSPTDFFDNNQFDRHWLRHFCWWISHSSLDLLWNSVRTLASNLVNLNFLTGVCLRRVGVDEDGDHPSHGATRQNVSYQSKKKIFLISHDPTFVACCFVLPMQCCVVVVSLDHVLLSLFFFFASILTCVVCGLLVCPYVNSCFHAWLLKHKPAELRFDSASSSGGRLTC